MQPIQAYGGGEVPRPELAPGPRPLRMLKLKVYRISACCITTMKAPR